MFNANLYSSVTVSIAAHNAPCTLFQWKYYFLSFTNNFLTKTEKSNLNVKLKLMFVNKPLVTWFINSNFYIRESIALLALANSFLRICFLPSINF